MRGGDATASSWGLRGLCGHARQGGKSEEPQTKGGTQDSFGVGNGTDVYRIPRLVHCCGWRGTDACAAAAISQKAVWAHAAKCRKCRGVAFGQSLTSHQSAHYDIL